MRIGTVLERSHVSLRQWALAIYLEMTSLKGISGMKLHREIGVAYKTAWFMLHRIREAWRLEKAELFEGPVEVDETYIGGLRKNMSKSNRETLTGRGPVGKVAVVGVKDRKTNRVRAMVVDSTDAEILQGFVRDNTNPTAKVYTDDATAYCDLPFDHESVKHGVGEYVRHMAHINGMRAFGQPSRGLTRAPITVSAVNTSRGISLNSLENMGFVLWTRSARWRRLSSSLLGSGSCTRSW